MVKFAEDDDLNMLMNYDAWRVKVMREERDTSPKAFLSEQKLEAKAERAAVLEQAARDAVGLLMDTDPSGFVDVGRVIETLRGALEQ